MPCSIVPVDPLRHQPLVAETLIRHGTALDAGGAFGEGNLFGRGQAVQRCRGCELGLCVDPGAQGPPILLNLPRQKRLVAQGQRARTGDLAHWLYRQLQTEYDHLTSDESVEDGIIANEYTFTEGGQRFG